ncbi:MAG TPA: carboxypeptidase regulatory-like domain-containing protein [Blastocatellia bacterium]|nr:carboxypeptidase regulatory-like domain-containing protein [Blastocatellia bacterium]
MYRAKFVLTMALFLLSALNILGSAQSSKGVIVGSVADSTGAVVKDARVKITNASTNVARETVSMAEGSYRFEAVDPGTYKVEISATGFKTAARSQVLVAAGQTTEVSFNLAVGSVGEVIIVPSDSTVILQTQDGGRTSTITERQIKDLPLATLNPSDLVLTLPGVVNPGVLASGFVQGSEFSINGLRPRANSSLIDGTENNDLSIHGQAYIPGLLDGFQEVSVLGGDNSAEYGRGGGAVVNLITKSGGNRFHGSAYDLIAPSALFSLSSGQKLNDGLTSVPVSIQNQYGFTLGGPIKKDKLFFFGTFQASPFRTNGATASAMVPTREGFDRLRALFPTGSNANVDRFLSVIGNLRGTTGPVNSIALGLDANGVDRGSIPFRLGTSSNVSQPLNDYQWLTRIDWAQSSKNNFTFRYIFDNSALDNQIPSAFDGYGIDVPGRTQNFLFSYTRNLSPRWTNEYRFAYGRFVVLFQANNPAVALNGPAITFSGLGFDDTFFGLDPTFPQGRYLNNFQVQDTITYTRGDHTIRAGVDLVRQKTKELVPFNDRGTLNFSAGGGYEAFGNFVDGFSGTEGTFGNKVFGSPVIYPNRFQQAYFVDDSWRIRSNLSVKLGLRYENFGTPSNSLPFPAFAGLDAPINTRATQIADNNNFAPRLSFAYTPHWGRRWFGQDKTVIRGGYQLSYDVFFDNILLNTAASAPNVFGANTDGINGGTPRGFANAGLNSLPTTGTIDPTAVVTSIEPNLVNPLAHTWNLGVQRELPGNIVVDVAYVGTRGSRLFLNQEINFGINDVRLNTARGPIGLRTNGGDSNYHSLQTRVERGLSKGLLFRFAYTYSKAIDDVNSEVFITTGGSSRASNPLNLRTDRSVASFDVPHRFVSSFVWDLPGPKKGVFGQTFGGWSLSGIYTLQSGAVETPYIGGIDLNGDLNAFNDRPAFNNSRAPANSVAFAESLGACNAVTSPTGYCDFNGLPIPLANARYVVDPAIRTNLAGRNTLRANWTNRADASLSKSFRMPLEGHQLQLRFEFFNVFNHANYTWARPGTAESGNGNLLSPNFNNVGVNDGGIAIPAGTGLRAGRAGRILVRYSF